MPKWSDIRALQFLDIYEKHECLWNPRIEAYKNKTARNNAFDEMLAELQIADLTANDIKLKIKSIRTTYKRELSAVLKAEATKVKYAPKLFWFLRADSFLRPVSTNRVSCASQINAKTEQSSEQYSASESKYSPSEQRQTKGQSSLRDKYKQETLQEITMDLNGDDDEDDLIETIEEEQEITMEEVKPQSHLQDHHHNGGETMQGETIAITHYRPSVAYESNGNTHQTYQPDSGNVSIVKSPQEDDEFSLFCRSVEGQLRSIPDSYSRSLAKFKIQQVLFEAETGHYRKSAAFVTIHNSIPNTSSASYANTQS